mmetsp:Transcript_16373/g.11777  ORF Transcript_16373/g.11777 Transcript_16373/m.11777 type:complete len:90 (+) Transcript_16373:134-403(+)
MQSLQSSRRQKMINSLRNLLLNDPKESSSLKSANPESNCLFECNEEMKEAGEFAKSNPINEKRPRKRLNFGKYLQVHDYLLRENFDIIN